MSVCMLAMVPYLRSRPAVDASVPPRASFYGVFLLALAAMLGTTPAQAVWLDRHEAIMGTNIDVELWHEDAAKGNAALDAVMDEMRRIDTLMSHYKPQSELSQINARAFKEPVVVDKELFDLIKT